MSKSKKEPSTDDAGSSSLRWTIINPSSSSRRGDEYDGYNRKSRSKSSDSSQERKKTKFGKPVARGSESGVIFDKGELKKITITISNKSAKPPLVHITNPETITPVRRPELTDYGEIKKYEAFRRHRSPSEPRRYEGKRPIFSKTSKEDSDSPENRNSSNLDYQIEGSRRKGESRKRHESPEHRSRKSKRDTLGGRKHRHSTPSRQSCSSDSSSSSDERRRKKHYYRMRSEREREERRRREYKRELMQRDIERRSQRPLSPPPPPHSNGSKSSCYSRERTRRVKEEEEEEEPAEEDASSSADQPFPPGHPPVVNNANVRVIYPVRLPRPPYMMRVPVRPFAPPFPPGYPHPPRPPGFYPMPPHLPVAFRPIPRPIPRPIMRPQRGFFRPSK